MYYASFHEIDSIFFVYNVMMRKYRDQNKRQTKLSIDNNNLIGSMFHQKWVKSFNRK